MRNRFVKQVLLLFHLYGRYIGGVGMLSDLTDTLSCIVRDSQWRLVFIRLPNSLPNRYDRIQQRKGGPIFDSSDTCDPGYHRLRHYQLQW